MQIKRTLDTKWPVIDRALCTIQRWLMTNHGRWWINPWTIRRQKNTAVLIVVQVTNDNSRNITYVRMCVQHIRRPLSYAKMNWYFYSWLEPRYIIKWGRRGMRACATLPLLLFLLQDLMCVKHTWFITNTHSFHMCARICLCVCNNSRVLFVC